MKKVIGQTVRDLKREVNKKVLKVPSIEQKVLDATSNEPWGPHGSLLADIAQATKNYHEYQMIMNVIWKRINDTRKNWRHVYKALIVLEYLAAHGSERVIDEIREHAYQISTLSDFHYVDSSGRDQGNNVRRKSQSLAALVNDKERVQEIRQKGAANRDKSRGSFSTGRSGGYGDHYEDDRYENRHASRDDDRYPRGGDPYGRERDRNGGYSDECYGQDGHRDDDVRGGRGNDDYQHGSRNRSLRRNRSFDDDDRYSSRSGGSRADDFPREERPLERKLSEQSIGAPPSYEEATRDAQNHVQENSPTSRNGDESVAAAPKASSPSAPKISSPSESTIQGSSPFAPADSSPSRSTNQGLDHAPVGVSAQTNNNNDNSFDQFDPRGSILVTPPAANGLEMDIFGSASDPIYSLSLTPFSTTTNGTDVDLPVNSGHGTDFMVMPSSSAVFSQPGENPFGDPPFIAIQENPLNQQEVFAPVNSFNSIFTGGADVHPPAAPKIETVTGFDFDSFGVTYNPVLEGQQSSFSSPASLTPEVPLTQPSNDFSTKFAPQPEPAAFVPIQEAQAATPAYGQGNLLPQSGQPAPFALQATQFTTHDAHPIAQINYQTTQLNHLSQPGLQAPVSMEPQPPAPIHVQGNLLPSSFASQTTQFTAQDDHPITQTNNQTTQLNFLSQPGLQALVSMEVQPAAPAHGQGNLPQSGQPAPFASQATQFTTQDACPITQINNHTTQSNLLSQPGPQVPISMEVTAPASALPPIKSAPLKEKFEPKSMVWADTLSRGLVNLNISGPKINPHADIGIDFDSMNRKERRDEKKVAAAPVSTTTMGKAMGSGTGIWRAGASSLSAPPNPMGSGFGLGLGMGMGMGMMGGGGMGMGMMGGGGMGTGMMGGAGMGMGSYGGNMNRPMGMGMNQGTPMGMGMNMGMNQGMPPQPPMGVPPGGGGMPGASYNPMMGMGNYGSQQPYGGGYR